jgi:hypothetical protein
MTKEAYFEMCETLDSDPLESEIPVDFEDFPLIVQEAFHVYNKLSDIHEGMSGTYMGKQLSGIKDILEILEVPVEEYKMVLELILIIDKHRSKLINDSKPKEIK